MSTLSAIKISLNSKTSIMALYLFINVLTVLPSLTFPHEYDVFLSFRGGDTRHRFIDHLHKALVEAGIRTFMDDSTIKSGEYIPSAIRRAIRESEIMIVVLSKNYASSTWCLHELAMGMHQTKFVLPIFYHLDPSDVDPETGKYGEVIAEHEKPFQRMVDKWLTAYKEIEALRRMVPSNIGEKKYDELLGEIEIQFKEMAERMKAARKEMEDLRRMVSYDIWDKIGTYDFMMDANQKRFKKMEEAARNEFVNIRRLVSSDMGQNIGWYDEAMGEIERQLMERILEWKTALKDVSFRKGFVIQDGYESRVIQSIVEEIRDKLAPSLALKIRGNAVPFPAFMIFFTFIAVLQGICGGTFSFTDLMIFFIFVIGWLCIWWWI